MNISKRVFSSLVIFISLFWFTSCLDETSVINDAETTVLQGTPVVLGKKLENPYAVKNMKKALENLKARNFMGRMKDDVEIYTTHLYVRFLPSNYTLYDTLTADSTLYLSDRPIDYEVEQPGDYYHDPTIPDTLPTYQYTAVPVGYVAPAGIAFETLEELYLPKEDTLLENSEGRMSAETERWIDELEYEALSITGNLPDDVEPSNPTGRTMGWLPSRFTPHGRVMVNDQQVGNIPLAGGKVRTRRWFEVHEAITDANGNFSMGGTYRYDFNYELVWERATFDVRSGTFGQATMDGPRCKCSWSPTISNGLQRFYASIFRAAHRYFYGNIDGLRRPFPISKMKISAYDGNKNGKSGDNWGDWDHTGLTPDIRMWRSVNGRERRTEELFSVMIHEIAHTTHIQVMNAGLIQYAQVDKTIYESWAVAVEWHITSMEYRERGLSNFGNPFFNGAFISPLREAFQFWPNEVNELKPYTPLFIDIVDNHNQAGRFVGVSIIDDVQGYSLRGIESGFLRHVYGLTSLRERLKANRPVGVTDQQIDILINQYL